MAQHTINVSILGDTYTDFYNPSTNYASAANLHLKFIGLDLRSIYIRVDLSTVPARKRIVSAILTLYKNNATIIDNKQMIVRACIDMPINNITYDNSPDMIPGSSGSCIISSAGVGNVDFDILTALTSALAAGVSTIWIKPYNSDAELMIFNSLEAASNKPSLSVMYEDVPPSAPTPNDPIGDYKDNKAVVRFAWQYNSDVGGTQKAFDLQWSTDQANWTTVSLTTANNYYDMPADTLPSGNIYWRVRCYNEYNEVGPYSDIQSFYAIGAPTAPVLNAIPTNTARPVVSWSAFSQQVYQLQVLSGDMIVYDSGVVPGISIRQHKIKAWLEDGEYTVQLRTKDEYDLWSDWASTTVTISTDKPEKPSIALQRSAYGVEITGTGLVYRSDYDKDDYICIGTASGTYFDNAVRSKVEYKYFIRAVSENDTFEDSDIKFIQAEFQYALIAPVSDLSNVFAFTRSLNSPPKRTYNHQPGGAFVEYAGRTRPVWEPTEHVNAAWAMTFFLKSWNDVEAFIALVDRKETVLYRDARGRKVYGILSNLTINDERSGYTVGFTLTEVDHIEEVEA